MALQIEKRIEKLESSLRIGDKPETLEDMFEALERGDYGFDSNPCTIVASILSNGGNGEHLRGTGLPDELINFFVDRFNRSKAGDGEVEKGHNTSAG